MRDADMSALRSAATAEVSAERERARQDALALMRSEVQAWISQGRGAYAEAARRQESQAVVVVQRVEAEASRHHETAMMARASALETEQQCVAGQLREALMQSEAEEALVAHLARDVDAQMKDYSLRARSALKSQQRMAGECRTPTVHR